MNKENFEKAEQDWIPVIGNFITCYARLEDEIYRTYKHYKKHYIKKSRKYFIERIDLFEKIMLEQVLKRKNDRRELIKAIGIFRENKDLRDLIAHNSISLTFEESASGELINTGFKVAKITNNDVAISLKELKQKLTKLTKAKKKLEKLLEEFYKIELMLVMSDIK